MASEDRVATQSLILFNGDLVNQQARYFAERLRTEAGQDPRKQIDMACDQATNTTGPILGKQIKAYAVTTKARLKTLPDIPTADEAGLKDFELNIWHGLFAPKGTPRPSSRSFRRC